MKPYEYRKLTEGPDKGDILFEGRKSSVGQLRTKGGDYRRMSRKSKSHKEARRILKRQDKARAKRAWQQDLEDQRLAEWQEIQYLISVLNGYE